MIVQLVRTGASPSSRAKQYGVKDGWRPAADGSWRTWACDAAREFADSKLVGPVVVTFRPTARDSRSVCDTASCWPAAQLVLEGLVAGGLLTGRRHEVAEMRVVAPRITGADGMIVVVEDAREPF